VKTLSNRAESWLRANYGTFKGSVRHALTWSQWLAGGLDDVVRPDLSGVNRLVFVCLGNINRSCFAESVARRMGASACSIGLSTTTGAPAFPRAVATAEHFGIDLSAHRATNLSDHRPLAGDLLLAMEVRHVRRLQLSDLAGIPVALLGGWGSPQRLHIHDPHVLSPEYFQTCFTLIEAATRNLVLDWRRQREPSPPEAAPS
jgi:protein-tyrosine phosphatase